MDERIRFGLRRYPLLALLFGVGGVGFVVWSRSITRPTFVFPLGVVDASGARVAYMVVGCIALAYLAIMTFVRFVRRPEVVLRDDGITLPIGEFAIGRVDLGRGDVLRLEDEVRRGGWRVVNVSHKGGTVTVSSSQLPDDDAYERVRSKLGELLASGARRSR